jgi:hypothetical protein
MKKLSFALVLVLCLAIAFPSLATPKVSQADLKIISECVKSSPRFKTKKNVVFAVYDGPIYQVMSHLLENGNVEFWREFLVKVKNQKCEILYSDEMGDALPISHKFPNDFGRKATRNSYRYQVSVEGREKLQKWLDKRDAKQDPLDSIQAEELQRLGFKVK